MNAFSYKNQLPNIKRVKVFPGFVGLFTQLDSLIINNQHIIDKAYDFFIVDNRIFYNGGQNSTYILDSNFKNENIIQGKSIINTCLSSVLMSFDSRIEVSGIEVSRRLALLDLKSNAETISDNRFIIGSNVIHENKVYYVSEVRKIACLDFNTDTILWQYSVSKIGQYTTTDNYGKPYQCEGEVSKVIGVFSSVLVAVISGGWKGRFEGNYQLIGLSIESGELLWQLDMFNANGVEIGYPYQNLQIDNDNTKLLGFDTFGFIEIDALTGAVKRFNDLGVESLRISYQDKILTNIYSQTITGNHLFFKATNVANRRHSLSSNVIGAINYITEEIDWLYEFEDLPLVAGIKESPKIDGNKLYALGQRGTLYIFERDIL